MRSGADAEALTLIEYRAPHGPAWVAGRDRSTLTATLAAVIRAANAIIAARELVAR
jgi:2-isopropylmalate synthase